MSTVCMYCEHEITEIDLGSHYVNCPVVRLALDPDYWPFSQESYQTRKHANAGKGPGIVINNQASHDYIRSASYEHKHKKVQAEFIPVTLSEKDIAYIEAQRNLDAAIAKLYKEYQEQDAKEALRQQPNAASNASNWLARR